MKIGHIGYFIERSDRFPSETDNPLRAGGRVLFDFYFRRPLYIFSAIIFTSTLHNKQPAKCRVPVILISFTCYSNISDIDPWLPPHCVSNIISIWNCITYWCWPQLMTNAPLATVSLRIGCWAEILFAYWQLLTDTPVATFFRLFIFHWISFTVSPLSTVQYFNSSHPAVNPYNNLHYLSRLNSNWKTWVTPHVSDCNSTISIEIVQKHCVSGVGGLTVFKYW